MSKHVLDNLDKAEMAAYQKAKAEFEAKSKATKESTWSLGGERPKPFAHLEQREREQRLKLIETKQMMAEKQAIGDVRTQLGDKAADALRAKFDAKRAKFKLDTNETLAALGLSFDPETGSWKDVAPIDPYAGISSATADPSGNTFEIPESDRLLWDTYNRAETPTHVRESIAKALADDGYIVETDPASGPAALKKVRMSEIEKFSTAIKNKTISVAQAIERVDVTQELANAAYGSEGASLGSGSSHNE